MAPAAEGPCQEFDERTQSPLQREKSAQDGATDYWMAMINDLMRSRCNCLMFMYVCKKYVSFILFLIVPHFDLLQRFVEQNIAPF